MKIIVTGAYGLLGRKVIEEFIKYSKFEVVGLVRKELIENNIDNVRYLSVDLTATDNLATILSSVEPQIIIHCAANVDLISCETNKEYTYNLHVKATEVLAKSPNLKKLIYISTDSVFDGEGCNYKEGSKENPLNYYAKTKLEGEEIAANTFRDTIVVRTNIYGINKELKNSLAEWGLKNLVGNNKIDGFSDVIFNPVSTNQLSGVLRNICESEYRGLINVASNENISKYVFLVKLAKALGKDKSQITQSSIKKYPSVISRPLNTTLDISLLKKVFNIELSIKDGVNEVIKEFKNIVV
jgi:dTDP-4-dehydrorhamnose reductase